MDDGYISVVRSERVNGRLSSSLNLLSFVVGGAAGRRSGGVSLVACRCVVMVVVFLLLRSRMCISISDAKFCAFSSVSSWLGIM